ncbi:MAG TPA: outer membrane beta-barrel protein, partial [Xanthobacteraceae bacterium]|nr:outer membrane beta-barrel protein [Xanthobacteraceae bacterium]
MKTLVRTTAFIAALATMPAAAADLYGRGPAFAAAPFNGYNWNGFYVGANLGYQWGSVTNWGGASPSGISGGGQIGYNFQVHPNWVLGLEADIQGSAAEDTFAAYKFSNPWFGTVRGRAGYAMNNVLFYVTGGLAYGGGRVEFAGLSESPSHFGWTFG